METKKEVGKQKVEDILSSTESSLRNPSQIIASLGV